MTRILPAIVLCILANGCKRPPAEPESKKPRPGETIEARLFLPEYWSQGRDGTLSVVYEIRRSGQAEPIRLEATDLPAEFLPDLYITFESDGIPLGKPLRIFYDPDC